MDCDAEGATISRSTEELGGAIEELLSKCRLLLLSSAGVQRGVLDVKHQLRLGRVGVRQRRIQIIVVKELPTRRIAASAYHFVHERKEALGVMPGTGAVPLGRGSLIHGGKDEWRAGSRGEMGRGILRNDEWGGDRRLRSVSSKDPITSSNRRKMVSQNKFSF